MEPSSTKKGERVGDHPWLLQTTVQPCSHTLIKGIFPCPNSKCKLTHYDFPPTFSAQELRAMGTVDGRVSSVARAHIWVRLAQNVVGILPLTEIVRPDPNQLHDGPIDNPLANFKRGDLVENLHVMWVDEQRLGTVTDKPTVHLSLFQQNEDQKTSSSASTKGKSARGKANKKDVQLQTPDIQIEFDANAFVGKTIAGFVAPGAAEDHILVYFPSHTLRRPQAVGTLHVLDMSPQVRNLSKFDRYYPPLSVIQARVIARAPRISNNNTSNENENSPAARVDVVLSQNCPLNLSDLHSYRLGQKVRCRLLFPTAVGWAVELPGRARGALDLSKELQRSDDPKEQRKLEKVQQQQKKFLDSLHTGQILNAYVSDVAAATRKGEQNRVALSLTPTGIEVDEDDTDEDDPSTSVRFPPTVSFSARDEEGESEEDSEENDSNAEEEEKNEEQEKTALVRNLLMDAIPTAIGTTNNAVSAKKKAQVKLEPTPDKGTIGFDWEGTGIPSAGHSDLGLITEKKQKREKEGEIRKVSLNQIDKARAIARRALKEISLTEEVEKMNIHIAWLNLEDTYGSEEEFEAVLQTARQVCDQKKILFKVGEIFESSQKLPKAIEIYATLKNKFRQDTQAWERLGICLLKHNQRQEFTKLQTASAHAFPKKPDHVTLLAKFAAAEYKYGDAQKGKETFETVLANFPKRADLWNVFLDLELKTPKVEQVRKIFERAITIKFPPKKMKTLFAKYLKFEQEYGTDKTVQHVRSKALEFVSQE